MNAFNTSKITFSLIAINVLAYVLVSLQGGDIMRPDAHALVQWGANFAPLTLGHLELWRLFTSIFLHGSLMHLAVNMYSLYSVGSAVELLCGRKKYLAVYIVCGLAASAASLGYNLVRARPGISIGASGAIFAICGLVSGFFAGLLLAPTIKQPSL